MFIRLDAVDSRGLRTLVTCSQEICRTSPMHFKNLDNLRVVAVGCLRGLKLLAEAGVVHCDMKAAGDAKGKCM